MWVFSWSFWCSYVYLVCASFRCIYTIHPFLKEEYPLEHANVSHSVLWYLYYVEHPVDFLTFWDWTEHWRSPCFFNCWWLLFGCLCCWWLASWGMVLTDSRWWHAHKFLRKHLAVHDVQYQGIATLFLFLFVDSLQYITFLYLFSFVSFAYVHAQLIIPIEM